MARRRIFDNGFAKLLSAVHEVAQEEYKKRSDFLVETSQMSHALFDY